MYGLFGLQNWVVLGVNVGINIVYTEHLGKTLVTIPDRTCDSNARVGRNMPNLQHKCPNFPNPKMFYKVGPYQLQNGVK